VTRRREQAIVKTVTSDQRVVLAQTYPSFREQVPSQEITGGRYLTRFARDLADLKAIQRLRFEVFNLELHEGLDASFVTGLDQDQYDLACHHLLVTVADTAEVVGTYRVQTRAMAQAGAGWYTASEYDLSELPEWLLEAAVETGRACVAKEHRNGRVLNHLWKGLAAYLAHNHKRFLFGCCSLTSQDPHLAKQTHDFLAKGNFLRQDIRVPTQPAFACYDADFVADVDTSVKLPPLFASYLKLGAKILGEPALDRHFKTIDYLALLDIGDLDPHTYQTFFSE
jgi:putative hemolysin